MLLSLAGKLACTGGQAGAFKMLVGNYVGVIMRYWFGSQCSFSDSKLLRFTLLSMDKDCVAKKHRHDQVCSNLIMVCC